MTPFEIAICIIGYAVGLLHGISLCWRYEWMRPTEEAVREQKREPHTTEWPHSPCKNCGAIKRIITQNEERGGYDRRCAFCGEDNDWVPEPVVWLNY